MNKRQWRIASGVSAVAFAVVASVFGGTAASAKNECLANGWMTKTYDYVQTSQSAGTCKYHKLRGKWFVAVSSSYYYYETGTKSDVQPGGTLTVGYVLPSAYQVVSYSACTDTASYSCTLGSEQTSTASKVFP